MDTDQRRRDLAARLILLMGDCEHTVSEEGVALYSSDIFWSAGQLPLAVAFPRDEADVLRIVRAARQLELDVVPRGAGVSYTKGYTPDSGSYVSVCFSKMDNIREVNTQDLYVRVEPGVRWTDLASALEPFGLSTGYRGPFSGLVATVGGAVSQHSAGFGSGRHGTVAECVLGVSIATAAGQIVRTGSAARTNAKPFTRYNGPDLTGLFLGDNGCFGLKTEIVLALQPCANCVGYSAFGFADLDSLAAAQVALAREHLPASSFGFDRSKALLATRSMRVSDGAKVLARVVKKSRGFGAGLFNAVKVASSGLGFLETVPFSLHLTHESDSDAGLASKIKRSKAICSAHGASVLPNSVPLALDAKPFGPLRGMLGADGERWVPVHGLFPLSGAEEIVRRYDAWLERNSHRLSKLDVKISLLTMTVDRQFFIEPAFYWKDSLNPVHFAVLGDLMREVPSYEPALEVREAVRSLRAELQCLFAENGGVSWQVARDYPFRPFVDPAYFSALMSVKTALDPTFSMNPGCFGLDRPSD